MKKQFMGKYASGHRKAVEQEKAQRDFIKSLPLAIRKAIKACDQARVEYNTSVINGSDREIVLSFGQKYHALTAQVDQMIKEHRHAA